MCFSIKYLRIKLWTVCVCEPAHADTQTKSNPVFTPKGKQGGERQKRAGEQWKETHKGQLYSVCFSLIISPSEEKKKNVERIDKCVSGNLGMHVKSIHGKCEGGGGDVFIIHKLRFNCEI